MSSARFRNASSTYDHELVRYGADEEESLAEAVEQFLRLEAGENPAVGSRGDGAD